MLFDGDNDYVNCGNVASSNGATEASWSFWFKSNTSSITDAFGKWNFGEKQIRIFMNIDATPRLNVRLSQDGTTDLSAFDNLNIPSLMTGNWQHCAIVFDGSLSGAARCKVYIDDVAISNSASSAPSSLFSSVSNFLIGTRIDLPPPVLPWSANIDEFSIWDKALTPSEVSEIYNSNEPDDLVEHSTSGNLKNWWRMGDDATWDGTDWTIPDKIGPNDGTSVNMAFGGVSTDVP